MIYLGSLKAGHFLWFNEHKLILNESSHFQKDVFPSKHELNNLQED